MSPLPEAGVNFPSVAGRRASTATGKQVCADAVRGLDPDLADRIAGESDWRHRYPQHLEDLALVEARSADAALEVARRGLSSAHEQFVVVTDDGDQPLDTGDATPRGRLGTSEVVGVGKRSEQLVVPHEGRRLHGQALLDQLDDWVRRGITEPGFADAVGAVVRHPEWLDLSDRTFGLLGAGAQMGPFSQLLSWGARVAAVDLPRPHTWERLIATARASAGRMLVPTQSDAAATDEGATDLESIAGADLLTQVAELRTWLEEVPGPLTVGNYGYVDGAGFVRLSMAFDALFTGLVEHRTDVSLAYLATPSDVFLVPGDAVRMARERHRRLAPGSSATRVLHRVSGGRFVRPNYLDDAQPLPGGFGLVNALILAQGPNYAVAKRIQRWRMVAARADGIVTSVHVAPPTRTRSVHSNPVMEQRQRLTAKIGIETFDAETAQALGAAILVHDLRNPQSAANPAVPLSHPHEAFMVTANPGGRWRVPLDPSSALTVLRPVDEATAKVRSVLRRAGRALPIRR